MSSLDNIIFQYTSGYWANTYLPGDSSMRLLAARLKNNNGVNIADAINQNIQPFDYPAHSALAIYLNTDMATIQGHRDDNATRMRIQIGIQASNRKGGHRSAMNIGLVFDLSNKTTKYAASMKALLLAMLKSKRAGDNISVTIAGIPAGGMLIKPKNFHHGQIQVLLNTLFANEASTNSPVFAFDAFKSPY